MLILSVGEKLLIIKTLLMLSVGEKLDTFDSIGRRKASNNKDTFDLLQRTNIQDKELEMSIEDQKKNIRILEKAYENNKISKDMYYVRVLLLHIHVHVPIVLTFVSFSS